MNDRLIRPLCLAVGLAVLPASATDLKISTDAQAIMTGQRSSSGEWAKSGYHSSAGSSVYIVELIDPPVATYNGGIKGLAATSNLSTGAKKLNTNSKASKAYHKHLKNKQNSFLANIGKAGQVQADYQFVFNGVAVAMTSEEAKAMASRSDVKKVYRERIESLNTDNGPHWISADSIWGGTPNNVPHSQGEGIVIAVLDSGINHASPSFADVGGDGYDHTNPLGSGNYVPGSYCDVEDPSFCNDKLIGAWSFVPDDAMFPVPEDNDGHGSHTASTAGGNVVLDATAPAPTTSLTRALSGVAPHANIIAYDVCVDDGGCPGSALLQAIDQVVVDASNLPDGIHALNYSISGGTDPYSDAVELGFLNATAAGVFVSASAGNSGPSASTLGHQSPWVATTGASTHDRAVVNSLIDLDSDTGALGDLIGAGFTAGYGPAPIVHAENFPTANGSQNDSDPGQCLDPFPPGTFSGEIVVCDRGSIARTAKGEHVLAGGAGGYVLANLAGNGESVSADAHFLPAVHLGVSNGDTLKAWIASSTNPMATIAGSEVSISDANGDVMAGFSSRGPNSALDILKPDITAPGVDILAAIDAPDSSKTSNYGFLSGTSMSSPHNAGAGAIVSAAQPGWTPYAVKSAIMMTADNTGVLKEDGATTADPFDMGAGRVNLARAVETDLVLDETPENFLAANPATGGDPKTLNIASMQDGNCVGDCGWTRTFTNTGRHTVHVDLSTDNDIFTVSPSRLKIKGGATGSFSVNANTLTASGWNFGQVNVNRRGDGPDLHMPIAVKSSVSTDSAVFYKSVDQTEAGNGDILTYTIEIINGQLAGTIDLNDAVPGELSPIQGSETEVIVDGTTTSPFSINGNNASWSGTLTPGSIEVSDTGPGSPGGGFLPLSIFGIAPVPCPEDCDDGSFTFNVPSFIYNGENYNQVIWSVNGTLEIGSASDSAATASIAKLPSPTPPNNLLAPFWSDLNLTDGGNMYIGVLSGGGLQWTVYEWNDIPRYGSNGEERYSFQIWIQNDATGNIWFTYAGLGDASYASVGAENSDGSLGSSYYFAPGDGSSEGTVPSQDLFVSSVTGGTATFTFQAEVDACKGGDIIVNEASLSADNAEERAIAVTTCD